MTKLRKMGVDFYNFGRVRTAVTRLSLLRRALLLEFLEVARSRTIFAKVLADPKSCA